MEQSGNGVSILRVKYYVYACGCFAKNTDFLDKKDGLSCKTHKQKINYIISVCQGCGAMMHLKPTAGNRSYCNTCGSEKQSIGYPQDQDYNALSLSEVSEIMGLTRERIRQIESVALRKFRINFKAMFPELYEEVRAECEQKKDSVIKTNRIVQELLKETEDTKSIKKQQLSNMPQPLFEKLSQKMNKINKKS